MGHPPGLACIAGRCMSGSLRCICGTVWPRVPGRTSQPGWWTDDWSVAGCCVHCWCLSVCLCFEVRHLARRRAWMGLSGKPTRELVNVDLGEKLAALGLAKFFPVEVRAVTLVQGWALCAVVHCRPGLQSMLRANCQQNLKLALSWARSTCTSLRISRSALEQSPCMRR
jgi:hypothetical protein